MLFTLYPPSLPYLRILAKLIIFLDTSNINQKYQVVQIQATCPLESMSTLDCILTPLKWFKSLQ